MQDFSKKAKIDQYPNLYSVNTCGTGEDIEIKTRIFLIEEGEEPKEYLPYQPSGKVILKHESGKQHAVLYSDLINSIDKQIADSVLLKEKKEQNAKEAADLRSRTLNEELVSIRRVLQMKHEDLKSIIAGCKTIPEMRKHQDAFYETLQDLLDFDERYPGYNPKTTRAVSQIRHLRHGTKTVGEIDCEIDFAKACKDLKDAEISMQLLKCRLRKEFHESRWIIIGIQKPAER